MKCPGCHFIETRVIDSRDNHRLIKRRRECLKCHYRFTTLEKINLPRFKIIKRDQTEESYQRDKIFSGISHAFEKRPFTQEQLNELTDSIEQSLLSLGKKEIKSSKIGDMVSAKIKETDEVAYLRFISVYKSFKSARSFAREADKLSRN